MSSEFSKSEPCFVPPAGGEVRDSSSAAGLLFKPAPHFPFPQRGPRTEKETELSRYWLEETGVLESFTKALAKLHGMKVEDRPSDPKKFIAECMLEAEAGKLVEDISEREKKRCQQKIEELEKKIASLKSDISCLSSVPHVLKKPE